MSLTIVATVEDASGVPAEFDLFVNEMTGKGWKHREVANCFSKEFAHENESNAIKDAEDDINYCVAQADWASGLAVLAVCSKAPHHFRFSPV